MTDFLDLSKQAYEAATTFREANWSGDLDYSLRAFRNEHASGSKYLSADYKHRSRLFRPKTRSVIRKNEAAGAVALFSNMDIVNVTPGNPDDPRSVAGAAAMKEVLEYRLTRTIPAFPLVMGALQDAQAQGLVVSYQYWEYESRNGKKIKDQPCIELRPLENIGLDGGASWIDPVGTTPYFYDIIPMHVCAVKAMMKNKDVKTGAPKWKKFKDSVILQAKPDSMEKARQARLGKFQDPHDESTGISDFDIVWVLRWFMKDSQNDDYTYYTLGTHEILSDPKPLEEVYFHGKRPYVIGCAILETHKAFKTSLPSLLRPLQQETNEIANQRIDNVKLVLNKRYFVARGRQADVNSLVRNVAGGVTLTTDPKTDIVESSWNDVTGSSYAEQDRLSADFDDLAGNFTPSTKVANNAMNDTLGGAKLANAGAGLMTDYLLRTVIETWWEPVLRQLVLLEQEYETDETIMAICGDKARLYPKFGQHGIYGLTEDLLKQEVMVNVNVGMGSSNPQERFQKLIAGMNMVMDTLMKAPPGFNAQEFVKEAMSNMGYRDGSRFFGDEDPRLAKAMQMIQQLQKALEGKQMDIQAKGQIEQMKLLSNEKIKGAELQVDAQRISGDLRIRETENVIEAARVELEKFIAQMEAQGIGQDQMSQMVESANKLKEGQLKLEDQRLKNQGNALKLIADLQKKDAQLEKVESA